MITAEAAMKKELSKLHKNLLRKTRARHVRDTCINNNIDEYAFVLHSELTTRQAVGFGWSGSECAVKRQTQLLYTLLVDCRK